MGGSIDVAIYQNGVVLGVPEARGGTRSRFWELPTGSIFGLWQSPPCFCVPEPLSAVSWPSLSRTSGGPENPAKIRMLKKSLALSFRYDTHRFAATAKILIQIVAVLIQIVALQKPLSGSRKTN